MTPEQKKFLYFAEQSGIELGMMYPHRFECLSKATDQQTPVEQRTAAEIRKEINDLAVKFGRQSGKTETTRQLWDQFMGDISKVDPFMAHGGIPVGEIRVFMSGRGSSVREKLFRDLVNNCGTRSYCAKNRIAVLTITEEKLNMVLSNTERAMVFNEYAKYAEHMNSQWEITVNENGFAMMEIMMDEWKERFACLF